MSKERVLVVDDERAVRDVLAALLAFGGYEATLTDGSDEALKVLAQSPDFDLVLTDVVMGDDDGLALLDRVGAEHAGIPVVVVTALQDVYVAINAFRRGAVDYLVKPFDRAQFLNVVSRAVEQGKLAKRNIAYRQNLEILVAQRTSRLRQAMQDLERSYDTTLEAMGDALDLRDEETEGHSRRVTAYTIELARAMGLSAAELKVIARGAFLHDIGKIATPDCILLKPGKLNASELKIMREHCRQGYEIVRKIPFLKEAAEIVYAHQERFDGMGYPRRLRGNEISLGARIFAIADTMDAMTSDRPYRKGTSFEAARQEIMRCAGGQFDPQIVEIFSGIRISRWAEIRVEVEQLGLEAQTAKLWRLAVA